MGYFKWIFLFHIITFLCHSQTYSQESDTICLRPSFHKWKNSVLNQFDSLTYKKFNSDSYLATNFWVVKESMKVGIDPDKLDRIFCEVLYSISDSINWNHVTIVFHNMRRGGTTTIYITIGFSDDTKTLGRFYEASENSYKQFKSLGFFNYKVQEKVLNAGMYTSSSFLILSKFDKNFKSIFSKVLIGPWYPDLEPLLRVYYSE